MAAPETRYRDLVPGDLIRDDTRSMRVTSELLLVVSVAQAGAYHDGLIRVWFLSPASGFNCFCPAGHWTTEVIR